jgi:hypothetical protein
VLKTKKQNDVVTPGSVILNALVREMKSAGVEYISVKELEQALTKK